MKNAQPITNRLEEHSRRRPVTATRASDRSRALGILVGYLWATCDIRNPRLLDGLNELDEQKLKRLRNGEMELSDDVFRTVRQHISSLLREKSQLKKVQQDYQWLRPLLVQIGLDAEINPHGVNQIPLDLGLLRALNIDPREQQRTPVYPRLGGLWHLIRFSTEEPGGGAQNLPYNLSLLNIKPPRYLRNAQDGQAKEAVTTVVSHFSVRSRFNDGRGQSQIYRGRVIESENSIYFLGDRRQYRLWKLFAMTWAAPLVPEGQVHADHGSGIVMTATAENVTVAGPIAALYISDTLEDDIVRDPNDSRAWDEKLSDFYDSRIKHHTNDIKAYSEADLRTILLNAGHTSSNISDTFQILTESVQRYDKYFRV